MAASNTARQAAFEPKSECALLPSPSDTKVVNDGSPDAFGLEAGEEESHDWDALVVGDGARAQHGG